MSRIKNLWNNRRANVWIFIELVIISIVTWIIADPVAVAVSDSMLPTGYDNDRLLIAGIAHLDPEAPGYDGARDTLSVNAADVETVLMKLRNHPLVEAVTIDKGFGLPGNMSVSFDCPRSGNDAVDTVVNMTNVFYYHRGTDFFQTLGIKSAEGSPSAEELSDMEAKGPDKVIITREMGELYWPGENAVGKKFVYNSRQDGEEKYKTVVGVVEGIRHQLPYRSYCAMFYSADGIFDDEPQRTFNAVIRLKNPANIKAQAEELSQWGSRELVTGNFYLRTIDTYNDFLEDTDRSLGIPNQIRLRYILAGFFLVNLILGVVGTFWLQTRKRITEMGIRRAFGAVRRGIVGMMVGENFLLATAACLCGFLLYWQYALRNGLEEGYVNNGAMNVIDNWITHFGQHFAIVSAIVYLLIILCVVVGTLIPATSVSRVDIVDTLRSKE
ncbi:MAG: FtsX-like permease family protein [Muribaculaceae bacterium]|nr:FtsX-like permease family protein [Muribaculaceae bacterium]